MQSTFSPDLGLPSHGRRAQQMRSFGVVAGGATTSEMDRVQSFGKEDRRGRGQNGIQSWNKRPIRAIVYIRTADLELPKTGNRTGQIVSGKIT